MASLVDFYKQKLVPVGQRLSSFIDRDKSMEGTQLMRGGLGNNAKSFGKQFVQAAAQTAPTVAQDFGNVFRNTFKNVPLLSTAGNIVGDTAQRIGSSTVDVAQGAYRTLQRPDLLGKLKGATQTVRGVGKALVAVNPYTPIVDIAANTGKEDSLRRRVATGYSRGISQIPELAPNTVAKNISIGDKENPLISFDPAMSAANMVGFVKNPINDKLFKTTTALIPSADKSLKLWLTTTAARGSLENILLGLPDMPDQMTTGQKAQWLATNAGIGAVQEIAGQGIIKGLGKVGSAISESKAGKAATEAAAKQFDKLVEFKRKWDIPYRKMGTGALSGQEITAPMWKWKLGLVDDGSMRTLASDIKIPKLSVEPTGGNLQQKKSEFQALVSKMETEKARLNKIDPNRQVTTMGDNLLDSKDYNRMQELGGEIARLEDSARGINSTTDIKEIVQLKRSLRQKGIPFNEKASKQELQSLLSPSKPLSVEPVGGKPIVAYHGSDTKIENFDLSKAGSNTDSGMFGKGVYFSGSPKEASTYARKTGNVTEYQLNLKNPYIIKSQADIPDIKASGTKEYSEKFTKYLQDKGFDGVIDEISPNKQYVVFDPKQITPSPLGGKIEQKTVTPIRKPLKEVYKEQLTPVTRVEPPSQSPELQRINTQIEAPKPVVSSDSIIPVGKKLEAEGLNVAKQSEQAQVEAMTAQEARSNLSNQAIKDINLLKRLSGTDKFAAGDVETFRREYPKLTEGVIEAVRENPQYSGLSDGEALNIALSLPTKAMTIAKKADTAKLNALKRETELQTKDFNREFGQAVTKQDFDRVSREWERAIQDEVSGITRHGKSVSVEPSYQTKQKIANKNRAVEDVETYRDWQKSVFGEAQTRTTKQAEKELEKAIKTSTNEASFKLDSADGWKDKSTLSFSRETMDRNFEDVMGSQAPELKRKLLEPVYRAEAQRNRFLNSERAQIKKLGIKAGSKESSLVQEYGEGNLTREQLAQQTSNPDKIIQASDFLRNKYDEYLGQLNKALTRNGYEPIPKRKDYFHHFQELSGAFDFLGVSLKAQDLPTDINGLTADFKPGKTFFSAALQRLGGEFKSDAIGGIDKYLEGASNQIYHTDNIQALRAFENALREKYAGTQHLSNFVANLTEYTNNIAGKKSMMDRAAESVLGRKIYGAATGLKRQVGANMVGANVSSALTNFIPLTQTLATTDKGSVLQAILATVKNVGKDDGFIQSSDFLTTRIGSDRLAKTAWQNVADKAGWLFRNIDSFTSQVVTRSKYLEAIKRGASEDQAMAVANSWARKLMAGRGKGEMPTLFNSQTLGALTQFQLEVNNQLSFMLKDIPRNFDKLGAASAIAQLFLYGYIFNNLYEKVTGRRPAFDPIGVIQRTYEDYTNPNMKKGQATKNLVSNVSNQLPFVSTFTGGRLPITSAIPNPMAVVNGESTLKKELLKPLQFVLPTGGGQIKKSAEGISAYNKGVSTSPSGRVRFTIPQTPVNRVKTALFGQWSTPEAQKYLREGQTPLGENQSKIILESNDKQILFDKIKARQLSDKQLTAVKDTLKSGNTKSTAVTTGKYVYFDDKTGDVNTLDLSKVTSMPSSTNYEQVKKETEKWKVADDILKLDPADQVEAFKQLGISKDDAEYYTVAKDSTEAKAAYIKDQVQGVKNYDEFLQKVAPLAREVNGEKILSDGVVDWMYQNDIITSAQRKQLKALEYDNIKKVARVSAKNGTTKVKKITAKKLGKFNLAGRVKKVKRIRTKQYKLVTKTK